MNKNAYEFFRLNYSEGVGTASSWKIKAGELLESAWALMEASWENRREFESIMKESPRREGGGVEVTPELTHVSRLAHNDRTISMLVAYAFENLLAAAYLTNPKNSEEPKDRIPTIISGSRGHDLAHLFEACEIEVSRREKEALRVMSEASLWRGKYQFPKKDTDYAEFVRVNQKKSFSIDSEYPKDIDFPPEIDSLLKKVVQMIDENEKGEPEATGQRR
jgi:hypothetical protein